MNSRYRGIIAHIFSTLLFVLQQLNFFDSVVIPLAKKLVSCGVLGQIAEELLENAFLNRDEWEIQGHGIMKIYLEHYQEEHIKHRRPSQSDLLEEAVEDEPLDPPVPLVMQQSTAEYRAEECRLSQATLAAVVQPEVELDVPERSTAIHSMAMDPKCISTSITDNIERSSGPIPPLLVPGTANSSVAGTNSYDGTGDETSDPDVVFAVLDNLDAPDDFDSYILLTPKQKREREAKAAEKGGTAPHGRRQRVLRSRSRGTTTQPANAYKRTMSAGSNHTRKSMASLFSASSGDSNDSLMS